MTQDLDDLLPVTDRELNIDSETSVGNDDDARIEMTIEMEFCSTGVNTCSRIEEAHLRL
jgi:uncharacterized metal-binding protein YceD (DUF177 family)